MNKIDAIVKWNKRMSGLGAYSPSCATPLHITEAIKSRLSLPEMLRPLVMYDSGTGAMSDAGNTVLIEMCMLAHRNRQKIIGSADDKLIQILYETDAATRALAK